MPRQAPDPPRERATAEKVTPQLIREKFVTPLSTLATEFATQAAELESAIKAGRIPEQYLPLVIKGMVDKIDDLRLFCNVDLSGKRQRAEAGKLRYREKYLEEKRKKYRES